VQPDEVSQWEAFVALVKAGRSVDEVAESFGFEPSAVKRILALGNLLPRIRTLYRGGQIDVNTVRHLTLASKSQQKAWLALFDDEAAYCPTGHQLKAWLLCRARHNSHYADRVIMPMMSCQSALCAESGSR
jgi:ParB family chromosome partitioning protein